MRKFIGVFLSMTLAVSMLAGCGGATGAATQQGAAQEGAAQEAEAEAAEDKAEQTVKQKRQPSPQNPQPPMRRRKRNPRQ